MLRPIGSKSSSVYWRRRMLILAAVVLLGLTIYVVFRSGGHNKTPNGDPSGHVSAGASSSKSHASSPAPVSCVPAVLKVVARTPVSRYRVGQQPQLEIQVTNTGTAPCIADLSDTQIELLVYNGESRVWGSHDCTVQPGSSVVTLVAAKPVRRSIRWTGLSSQPQCAGNRMRVGIGTYTLRARLGIVQGSPATFMIVS
jgi:hypothetical protein